MTVTEFRGDEADQAFILTQIAEQEMMSQHRSKMDLTKQEGYHDWDGETCVDCGEDIPPQRLAMGISIRCVDCQELKERRG